MLAEVDFPWAIKPIIRWHHERCDGSGFPDGRAGEAIPISAQIVGITDLNDDLTTSRPGKRALPEPLAVKEIERRRHWWSDQVYEAFATVFARRREPESAICEA